jgi:hypothetical protein
MRLGEHGNRNLARINGDFGQSERTGDRKTRAAPFR